MSIPGVRIALGPVSNDPMTENILLLLRFYSSEPQSHGKNFHWSCYRRLCYHKDTCCPPRYYISQLIFSARLSLAQKTMRLWAHLVSTEILCFSNVHLNKKIIIRAAMEDHITLRSPPIRWDTTFLKRSSQHDWTSFKRPCDCVNTSFPLRCYVSQTSTSTSLTNILLNILS
jgi:hypothetical protein